MIETDKPVVSTNDLPEGAIRLLRKLCASGGPIMLTVNGTVRLALEDTASLRALLEFVDRLETITAVREGLEEIEEGKGVTLEEFKEAVHRKYGIPPQQGVPAIP